MKKLLCFGLLCLMAFFVNAQRCAVLEFKAGSGVSQADVDGISAIFITYFQPAGYTMVERTQIDKVIEEQGFQRSRMTQQQMVRVGEILNVSKIVVGDVNMTFGQYNVDVRVVNVETGTIAATEGASFNTSSFRNSMQSLSQKLAGKIAITSGGTVNGTSTTTAQGYVDLGLPSGTRWRTYNAAGLYTCDEAVNQFGKRLPSKVQWEELKAECQWSWTGSGYKVTGPNGHSITLSAEVSRRCDGTEDMKFPHGNYWSSTPSNSDGAWFLFFMSDGSVHIIDAERCDHFSVRLVQD